MQYIQDIVKKLVRKYKTRDPFELCSMLDIEVLFVSLPDCIRGIYQYYRRGKVIYINNALCRQETKKVCAHELGHALVHKKLNVCFLGANTYFHLDRFEIEADTFAAELLIPDDDMRQYYGTGYSIEYIAKDLEVNESLVHYKIKNQWRID